MTVLVQRVLVARLADDGPDPGLEPATPPDPGTDLKPGSEEVLAICKTLLGQQLGWDDKFVDHGGHSIVIARLAQGLHVAGWTVPVRALLSDCDTARKIASRQLEFQQQTVTPGEVAEPDHQVIMVQTVLAAIQGIQLLIRNIGLLELNL